MESRRVKSTVGRALGFSLLLFGALAAFTPRVSAQGGVPLWTNRYNGTGNTEDRATAIVVDASGNVIVTGYSTGSSSGYDFATIKYSNTGVPLWTNRYVGPGTGSSQQDYAAAVTVDSNNNIFVTGTSEGTNSYGDYLTIKYSSAGNRQWARRYNGPGNSLDEAAAVAVDSDGNVFVTGHSYKAISFDDYASIMYSNAGFPLWTNRYAGPINGGDYAVAVGVTSSNHVFVFGQSRSGSNYDYVTLAYSTAGLPLWTNRYDGQGNGNDYAMDAVVDHSGNILVTGYSSVGPYDTSSEYTTIKYSDTGIPLWTNHYMGPWVTGGNAVRSIAVDGTDNVFVTGSSTGVGNEDFATVAYSSTGVPLWTNRYNGRGNGGDVALAVVADGNGNVVVIGSSYAGSGNFENAMIAYSNAGVPLWTNHSTYGATAIAADNFGNLFATGGSSGDFLTIKYSAIMPSVHLDYQMLNSRLVLTWTNGGFSLQTAPASTGTFTNLPGATSPYTNSLTAAQQFFRLKKN